MDSISSLMDPGSIVALVLVAIFLGAVVYFGSRGGKGKPPAASSP